MRMHFLNGVSIAVLIILCMQYTISLHIKDDLTFILRQKRNDHPHYYGTDQRTGIPVKEKFRYLADFVVIHQKHTKEFGENCSVSTHKIWSDNSKKSLLSGGKDSFQLNTDWRGKICNIFKYLDCVSIQGSDPDEGKCRCAPEDKVGMKLYFDPYIDYQAMFKKRGDQTDAKYIPENKKMFRFWCRADEGGLCGYVRLVPNKTLPGIDFPYPDVFPCMSFKFHPGNDTGLEDAPNFDFSGKGRPRARKAANDSNPDGRLRLVCDHDQLTSTDVHYLGLKEEDIGKGLDVEKDKVRAFRCRNQTDNEANGSEDLK